MKSMQCAGFQKHFLKEEREDDDFDTESNI